MLPSEKIERYLSLFYVSRTDICYISGEYEIHESVNEFYLDQNDIALKKQQL